MKPLELINYKNYTIEIAYSQDIENPRTWDNMGKMVCFHSRYNLGDDHTFEREDIEALTKNENIIWLPLYLYDHSGITMNTTGFSCRFDSGMVGIIYVDKSTNKEVQNYIKENNWSDIDILEVLKEEVETYDKYLRGEVFEYDVKKDGESLDYCGGYYEMEDAISEAKSIIDYDVKKEQRDKAKKLKELIKKRVPLNYRAKILNLV